MKIKEVTTDAWKLNPEEYVSHKNRDLRGHAKAAMAAMAGQKVLYNYHMQQLSDLLSKEDTRNI